MFLFENMKREPRNSGQYKKSKNVRVDQGEAKEQLNLISIIQDQDAIKKK